MREVGRLTSEELAIRFRDHLESCGMGADAREERAGGWSVWVRDDGDLEAARRELEDFRSEPDAERYRAAGAAARRARQERERAERRAARLDRGTGLEPRTFGERVRRHPVTWFLILGSIGVAVLNGMDGRNPWTGRLQIDSFPDNAVSDARASRPGGTGDRLVAEEVEAWNARVARIEANSEDLRREYAFHDIKRGEVWRLVTPAFIHFGPLHIFFNMLWVYYLGRVLEDTHGRLRTGALALIIGVFSNGAQYVLSGYEPWFGGMSGVVTGLFGFAWMKAWYDPWSRLAMSPQSVAYMLIFLVLCVTGGFGPVANYAHFGGLFAGMALAFAPGFQAKRGS